MKTSDSGIKLIQQFEGCRLRAYDDLQPNVTIISRGQVQGTLTIGYGHTGPDVYPGQIITKATATNLLRRDLGKFERIVTQSLKVKVTQNMFDALVSHAYNCGNVKMIAACLNKDDIKGTLEYSLKPNTSKGVVLQGLIRRRKAEYDLFIKDMYLKPTKATTRCQASNLEVRWIQTRLNVKFKANLTVDGDWGDKTAKAVGDYRESLGWKRGNTYQCTDKLLKKFSN